MRDDIAKSEVAMRLQPVFRYACPSQSVDIALGACRIDIDILSPVPSALGDVPRDFICHITHEIMNDDQSRFECNRRAC